MVSNGIEAKKTSEVGKGRWGMSIAEGCYQTIPLELEASLLKAYCFHQFKHSVINSPLISQILRIMVRGREAKAHQTMFFTRISQTGPFLYNTCHALTRIHTHCRMILQADRHRCPANLGSSIFRLVRSKLSSSHFAPITVIVHHLPDHHHLLMAYP